MKPHPDRLINTAKLPAKQRALLESATDHSLAGYDVAAGAAKFENYLNLGESIASAASSTMATAKLSLVAKFALVVVPATIGFTGYWAAQEVAARGTVAKSMVAYSATNFAAQRPDQAGRAQAPVVASEVTASSAPAVTLNHLGNPVGKPQSSTTLSARGDVQGHPNPQPKITRSARARAALGPRGRLSRSKPTGERRGRGLRSVALSKRSANARRHAQQGAPNKAPNKAQNSRRPNTRMALSEQPSFADVHLNGTQAPLGLESAREAEPERKSRIESVVAANLEPVGDLPVGDLPVGDLPADTAASSVATQPRRQLPAQPRSVQGIQEIKGIARARLVLAANPKRALALLTQVARQHPDGYFREEREALTVLALAKLGRTDRARARAERFLQRYPQSPFSDRVRIVRER